MPHPRRHLLAAVVCLFLIASCASADPVATGSLAEPTAESDGEDVATAEPAATADPSPEPEPIEDASAAPAPAPSATPIPTAAPAVVPTSMPQPTPTVVPPTPVWVRQDSGPSTSPYSYVVVNAAGEVEFVDGPDGSETDAPADGDLVGAPVLSGGPEDDTVEVALATGTAWVRTDDLEFGWSSRILEIDVAQNRIRVFDGNELLADVAAATGARGTPTSALSGHVRIDTTEGSPPELTLVGHAEEGEDGVSVELVVSEDELGGYTTDGAIEVERSSAFLLAALLQNGARVEIVGAPEPLPTPAPPRPTAVPVAAPQPTPTPIPEECPESSLGTPGDCYFVVDGQKTYGPCGADYAVTFGDTCWIFAGDKTVGRDGFKRCPETAQYEKDDRCYSPAGFREVVDIICPSNATAVDLECRVPAE